MKSEKKTKASPRSGSPMEAVNLSPAVQIQELRSYIEREKGKQQANSRFKDASQPRSGETGSRPISGTSTTSDRSRPPIPKKPNKDSYVSTEALMGDQAHAGSHTKTPESGNEVNALLQEIGLERYANVFQEQGVEDLETAMEMNEGHLAALGVALGHRIKILKKLKEKRLGNSPREERKDVKPAPSKVVEKVTSPKQSTYALYKTALEEFRNFTNPDPSSTSKPSSAKGSVSGPSNALQLPAHRPPTKPEPEPKRSPKASISHDPKDSLTASSGPEASLLVNGMNSCWECFKTFFRDVGEVIDEKRFCSKSCRDKFLQSNSVTCICGALALKATAVFHEGVYYCSPQCVPNTSIDRETSVSTPPEEPDSSEDLHVIIEHPDEDILNERAKDDSPGKQLTSATPLSVTLKINQKYRKKGNATIKEAAFEDSLQKQQNLLMDSTEQVKGWDAPVDASFDLEIAGPIVDKSLH